MQVGFLQLPVGSVEVLSGYCN